MGSAVGHRLSRRAVWLVASVSLLQASCTSASSNTFYVRVSGRVPTIAGRTLAGGTVSPALFSGKVVVANFWNPYCPPCRIEQPLLQAAWRRLASSRVQFIGPMFVGGSPPWPNDPQAARTYLALFHVTYPTLVDDGSRIARGFGVPGIPTTVVADATGRLRFKVIGQLHLGELETLIRMARQGPSG
jgi:thiol-disulfide isomerase/thioredoxin